MKSCLRALLAAMLLLAACGGDVGRTPVPSSVPTGQPTAGEVVTITFACPDYRRSKFIPLAQEFGAANPDIRVQVIAADELRVPNLAAVADTFVGRARFGPSDWASLLDLGPFVGDPAFPGDDFYPGSLDYFRDQGRLYGLPAEIDPILIFYDPAMFEQAGLPYPQIGWTWGDFATAASQLTVGEGARVDRYGFVDQYPDATILAMMQQYGISLWDGRTSPPQPLFDTPEVAAVLRRYTDMALASRVMPALAEEDATRANSLVEGGEAAMWTDVAYNRIWRADLGMVPFPEETDAANPRSMWGFFISGGTTHPWAAWRWISYLSANYRPDTAGRLPGRRSLAAQLTWWAQLDEGKKAAYEYALDHPSTNDSPLNLPLGQAIRAVFESGNSVEKALSTAQSQALAMQALTVATAPTARPVPTPRPQPGDGQGAITFCYYSFLFDDKGLFDALADSFHQRHPDVWVDVLPEPSSDPAELAQACDCFVWEQDLEQYYPYRQYVRPLDPLLEMDPEFDLGDYYPQFLEPLQQEGALWGIPYQANVTMVYLNLDRFAEAGVAIPQRGWTIDDFLNTARALSGGDRYGFTTPEGAYGDLIFVLERMGARLVDTTRDPPVPTFTDPTVVTALGQYASLSREQALSLATPSVEYGWPGSVAGGVLPAGVEGEQAAMWIDYSWKQLHLPPLAFSQGTAPLPIGATASTELWIFAYFISAGTSEPEVCWDWLSFVGSRPETVRMLPARRSIAADPIWQEQVGEAALPAYLATLEYQNTPVLGLRFRFPWLGYAYPWLYEAFEAVIAGQEAQAALSAAQAKAEALVACLGPQASSFDHGALLSCAQQVDPDYPVHGGQ